MHSALRQVFVRFLLLCIFYSIRYGFYAVFGVVNIEVEVLLGVCDFVVDICDNCPFSFLMKMSKNGNYLKLCSVVNFIFECRFWSKLCF